MYHILCILLTTVIIVFKSERQVRLTQLTITWNCTRLYTKASWLIGIMLLYKESGNRLYQSKELSKIGL